MGPLKVATRLGLLMCCVLSVQGNTEETFYTDELYQIKEDHEAMGMGARFTRGAAPGKAVGGGGGMYNGAQGGYGGELAYYRCTAPEGYPGSCKPRATCASYYATTAHYDYARPDKYKSCNYGYGYRGVCCPEVYYKGRAPPIVKVPHYKRPGYDGQVTHVPEEAIPHAVAYANAEISSIWTHDTQLGKGEDDDSYWNNGVQKDMYMKLLHKTGWVGYYISLMTLYLKKEHAYNPMSYYDGGVALIDKYMHHLPPEVQEICSIYTKYRCNPYAKWRTIDGSCNNLRNPYYGQAMMPTIRLAPPQYSDFVWAVKRSKDGGPMPVARTLRHNALPNKKVAAKSVNALYTYFMQHIVHDTIQTTFYQTNDGQFLDCCQGYHGGDHQVSPKCYPMDISKDDPFYGPRNVKCVNLARNMLAPNYHCSLGYGNQLSMVTPWVDASVIYGNNEEQAGKQRTHKGGQLKMSKFGDQYLIHVDKDTECETSAEFCLGTGDFRASQNPGLIVVETILTRFHNYCAVKLSHYNPHWDDEYTYQECRRITIAVYQNIAYNEALPLLLGWKFMYDHNMLPVSRGYSYDWDEYVNPATYAEFSGATMRCHTSVYEEIYLVDEYYKVKSVEPLKANFNNPKIFKHGENFDAIARGLMYVNMREVDNYYDTTMVDYMFQRNRTFGFDIGSFNLLRNYEYGLRGYNDYREMCGLKRAHTWEDFGDWIEPHNIELLKANYKYVDDVTLYTGGLMERHQYDSLMGPTWWCVVSQQFYNWKVADNWFFDLGGRKHSFLPQQLDQIRHMSMAGLLCQVTDITHVPAFAFHTVSYGNPIIPCANIEEIPRLNFAAWKTYGY